MRLPKPCGKRGKGSSIWNLDFVHMCFGVSVNIIRLVVLKINIRRIQINMSYGHIPIQGIEKMCELVFSRIVAVYSVKGK